MWRLSEQKAGSFLQRVVDVGLTLRSNSGDPTDSLSSLVVQVRKIFLFLILWAENYDIRNLLRTIDRFAFIEMYHPGMVFPLVSMMIIDLAVSAWGKKIWFLESSTLTEMLQKDKVVSWKWPRIQLALMWIFLNYLKIVCNFV